MIIMKFGGTSVRDASALQNVAQIISERIEQRPIIVLSAMAGITNLLEESVMVAVSQQKDQVGKAVHRIRNHHLAVISELFRETVYFSGMETLVTDEVRKLEALLSASETIKVKSEDLNHAVLSIGEILSTRIFSTLLEKQGLPAKFIDARDIMISSNDNQEVVPHPEVIREKALKKIVPLTDEGYIVVTQGFIATTPEGAPTTLGRNGSDYSASLLGAAVNAQEIQIWTDVDGILSADPSIIPEAKVLETMTFDEASELAYFGARVLYPASIQPALAEGIAVRVLNSNRPGSPGTRILNTVINENLKPVKSIAYKENITLLTIKSSRLLLSTKLLSEFFQHLTEYGVKVFAVSKSAIKLTLTIEANGNLKTILEAFKGQDDIQYERNKAIVSVVGETMAGNQDYSWEIIQLLSDNKIRTDLISQFASQISFMFIINEKDIDRTVKLLHSKYIEN